MGLTISPSGGGGTTLTDSASLRTALSDENGTGVALFDGATSPTFVTPALGTPASGIMTNVTGTASALNIGGSAASLSISGQTGILSVTGLASTNRAKTVRDAADTILELGGSYTPTGVWTSLPLTTPKITTGINDTNANSMLAFTPTASAVDGFTFTNAATANPATVTMAATGSDSNIRISLLPKGTGFVQVPAGVGSSVPGLSIGGDSDTGLSGNGNDLYVISGGVRSHFLTNGYMFLGSAGLIGWTNTTDAAGTRDTALYRNAAGVVEVNTATPISGTSNAGSIKALTFIPAGTATTCTGATIGTGSKSNAGFVTATTTGVSTIVITFPVTAPTGWSAMCSNITNAATLIQQTAKSTTTATLIGTTASGDIIQYIAMAY